jgi:putative transposase
VPVGLAVDGANRPDYQLTRQTIEGVPVERPEAQTQGRGKQHMCLDKGYDYAEVDELMEEFKFTEHISRRGEDKEKIKRSARKKARRWVSERAHSWMNRFRAILIRWNKKAQNYIAMLHFALAIIAYRAAGVFG